MPLEQLLQQLLPLQVLTWLLQLPLQGNSFPMVHSFLTIMLLCIAQNGNNLCSSSEHQGMQLHLDWISMQRPTNRRSIVDDTVPTALGVTSAALQDHRPDLLHDPTQDHQIDHGPAHDHYLYLVHGQGHRPDRGHFQGQFHREHRSQGHLFEQQNQPHIRDEQRKAEETGRDQRETGTENEKGQEKGQTGTKNLTEAARGVRGRNLAKENEKHGNSGTRVKHATRDHARGSVSEKDRNARNPKKERGTGQGKKKNLKKATEEVAAEIGHRIDEREGNQGIRKTVPLSGLWLAHLKARQRRLPRHQTPSPVELLSPKHQAVVNHLTAS